MEQLSLIIVSVEGLMKENEKVCGVIAKDMFKMIRKAQHTR